MASENISYESSEVQLGAAPSKVKLTPIGVLPSKVIEVMPSSESAGMPHGSLLICEYTNVGSDPVAFLRSCKNANIHIVISVGKKDPHFMAPINAYLTEKKFASVDQMDIPRCLHSKIDMTSEKEIMGTAGNAVCGHLDLGCNVLILSDQTQTGRLVACYAYGWTKCVLDTEDLKEPLRVYVKRGGDKKMLNTGRHYSILSKYKEVQGWYLQERMNEFKQQNGGHVPSIEHASLNDIVERGPASENTIVVDPLIEEVAEKVRAKCDETGLSSKEIIAKHVRKEHNQFVWTD